MTIPAIKKLLDSNLHLSTCVTQVTCHSSSKYVNQCFSTFTCSGTLYSNFDCSRNTWSLPEICLGENREIRGRRPRVGKSFLERGQQASGSGGSTVSSPSGVRGRAPTANAFFDTGAQKNHLQWPQM